MSTCGVLYLSTGNRGELLRNSMGSLERTNPHLPVHLITDRPYDVPLTWTDGLTGLESRRIKTRLDRYTPFDVTLFLDDDTYVAGPLDPQAMLGDADLAMVVDPSSPVGLAYDRKRSWRKHICQAEAEETFALVGREHLFFNSGVMVWRRNARTQALFEAWEREWRRYGNRDQFALLRALSRVPVKLNILPERYNTGVSCRPHPEICNDDVRIYHFFCKKRSARRLGLWCPPAAGPYERAFQDAAACGPMAEHQYRRLARHLYQSRPCRLLILGVDYHLEFWRHSAGGEVRIVPHAEFLSSPAAGGEEFDYMLITAREGQRPEGSTVAWARAHAKQGICVYGYGEPEIRRLCHRLLGHPQEVVQGAGELAFFARQSAGVVHEPEPSVGVRA